MDGPVAAFIVPHRNSSSNTTGKRSFQTMSYPFEDLPTNYPSYLQARPTSSPNESNHERTSQLESSSPSSASSSAAVSPTSEASAAAMPTQNRRGLDERTPARITNRPISIPQNLQFIDLTEDTNSPQNTSNRPLSRRSMLSPPSQSRPLVIDLSDSSDDHRRPRRPSSPDVQFVRSQARARSASAGLGAGLGQRRLRAPNDAVQDPSRNWIQDQLQLVRGGLMAMREELPYLQLPHRITDVLSFRTPEGLNFEAPGFDLDFPHRQPAPPPPTYTAPSTVRAGFTRSNVTPGSLMVCPLCDDELGVGESEQKRQVWVAKICGHVYCGECAGKRLTGGNKKRKLPSGSSQQLLRNCVVDKCNKRLSAKNDMLQIFL